MDNKNGMPLNTSYARLNRDELHPFHISTCATSEHPSTRLCLTDSQLTRAIAQMTRARRTRRAELLRITLADLHGTQIQYAVHDDIYGQLTDRNARSLIQAGHILKTAPGHYLDRHINAMTQVIRVSAKLTGIMDLCVDDIHDVVAVLYLTGQIPRDPDEVLTDFGYWSDNPVGGLILGITPPVIDNIIDGLSLEML